MSLPDFQSALVALYSDASLRASFYADPSAGIRNLNLSPSELRALAGLDRERLDWYCRGLAAKRASRLQGDGVQKTKVKRKK
ncbi:MAG: hypothetical protein ABL955_03415 [Elusimicrobiota bacterium]